MITLTDKIEGVIYNLIEQGFWEVVDKLMWKYNYGDNGFKKVAKLTRINDTEWVVERCERITK